jgi:hypothetical protein
MEAVAVAGERLSPDIQRADFAAGRPGSIAASLSHSPQFLV